MSTEEINDPIVVELEQEYKKLRYDTREGKIRQHLRRLELRTKIAQVKVLTEIRDQLFDLVHMRD